MDYKLILVFVDDEKSDRVLDAAREAGASGATMVPHARGQGSKELFGIFGLEVLSPPGNSTDTGGSTQIVRSAGCGLSRRATG